MISDSNSTLLEQDSYREVAIANFGTFQIAIASDIASVSREIFSVPVPLPSRYYSSKGFLIWKYKPAFNLSGLTLTNLFPEPSPFPSIKRLSAGIPISFEIKSTKPLPQELIKLALLQCQILEEPAPYHTVFRDIAPRFVQIVPNQGILQLGYQVQRCLQQEKKLIQDNWQQLKKTKFYHQNLSKPTHANRNRV